MSGLFFPLALAIAGFVAAFLAYRGIRRGGARFYTLEREAILRRASLSLMGSVLLFAAAIGLLVWQQQQMQDERAAAGGEVIEGVTTPTTTPSLEQFPPLPTETPTPDLTIPTPTATRPICRAVVEGTQGTGLTLRDTPGGQQLAILAEADLVTMLDEPSQEENGLVWRKVRSLFGDEGWVAEQYLSLGTGCE